MNGGNGSSSAKASDDMAEDMERAKSGLDSAIYGLYGPEGPDG